MNLKSNKTTAAVCGLFCPACLAFISTHEEPERLNRLAALQKQTIEETQCDGCRAEKRTKYCKECKIVKCAAQKGIDFCGECNEYPCKEFIIFQSLMPHRIELMQSQQRIKEVGYEIWYQEMIEHYSCPECRTINSAYDNVCRKCGASPSCSYVSVNKETILEFNNKTRKP